MPLDVLGRTRATLTSATSSLTERGREIFIMLVVLGIDLCNFGS